VSTPHAVDPIAPRVPLVRRRRPHPIASLIARRVAQGVLTLLVVSVLIFLATQVLPGNAAFAVLGHTATPTRLHALEAQLHLNRGLVAQYGSWFGGLLTGDPGRSLVNHEPVWSLIYPRLINSGVLVGLVDIIASILGVTLGTVAALRKDRVFDNTFSVIALAVTALPEFVVALALIILFSTLVFHLLPGVSFLPPGVYAWSRPNLLILPVLTLVIVTVPYIYRMMRASMIEALESEYVEMARLKGLSPWRVALVHAMPAAIAPTIQVIGLTFLYLAGGIVLVEFVFGYPGIGQGLVDAVNNRDIPVIQLIVLVLAAFYVVMNIVSDVVALLATPRRRVPR
jgi:peptide/nickel transport system permease protein